MLRLFTWDKLVWVTRIVFVTGLRGIPSLMHLIGDKLGFAHGVLLTHNKPECHAQQRRGPRQTHRVLPFVCSPS
ncbi:hypothetical protein VFPFJ_10418 [Purpureocillium lilacinum]|uniref:Uncharacterized protein n=1 Tax=Purpureocillium lilacinum TaxID=33203 RepID=A0A179GMD1_PURLI|nr:hypothetical protein VFPFJ_10418 [Purpureocillium lilacinum]OAQ76881.1 hypothetical protein VFPFJ_10418 [Purpureocillium lilacinum]OAQ78289.1 hypothetical protein VFPBJ_06408 [Purpureocillium lilacinum]